METISYDPGSFKDPSGRVFSYDGQIYRQVDQGTLSFLKGFFKHPVFPLVEKYLVPSQITQVPKMPGISGEVILHQKVSNISYCYEWLPEQLRLAAIITLKLQIELLKHDFALKDATPFNILFDAYKPVFIDLTSVYPIQKNQPWVAFTEFLENFTYPLMAYSYLGIAPNKITMSSLGKIKTEEAALLFKYIPFYKKGIIKYVKAPNYLRAVALKDESLEKQSRLSPVPREILLNNCQSLLSFIEWLPFAEASTHWGTYTDTRTYNDADKAKKTEFLSTYLSHLPNLNRSLDIGANTGEYSKLLAKFSKSVIAVESDIHCLQAIYKMASREKLEISPLLMDFTQPTPALGWDNVERQSFMDRFKNSDALLAMAIIHHLRFTGNVPLERILDTFHALSKNVLVEWVPPTDPMSMKLKVGKEDIYQDYTEDNFVGLAGKQFVIRDRTTLSQGRILFALSRK